jgi:hypothetical protein
MGLNAKNKEYSNTGNHKAPDPVEPGSYPGRLVQVIDLGVQEQRAFKGEPKPPAQEIMTTYELVDEFLKDEEGNDLLDKPRWISENFPLHNLKSERARSTARYLALDPTQDLEGDWTALAGTPVMVTIVNEPGTGKNAGKIYNNIGSTNSMRKRDADKLPELKNPAKIFDQSDVATVDVFFTLPEWLQKKIKEGLEFEGSAMADAVKNYKKKEGEKDAKQDKKAAVKKQQKEHPADDGEAPFDTDEPSKDDSGDW